MNLGNLRHIRRGILSFVAKKQVCRKHFIKKYDDLLTTQLFQCKFAVSKEKREGKSK